ncbi:vanadium-dependent haloperoxidase [Streptomyces sp. NPDC003327]
MRIDRRGVAKAVVAMAGAALTTGGQRAAATVRREEAGGARPGVVAEWVRIATGTSGSETGPKVAEASVWHAYVALAMYNAVVGIEPRYAPYRWAARGPRGASPEAAAVSAAYHVLLAGFPAAEPKLTESRTASLAAVPDGPAKDAGVAFGRRAAEHLTALRAHDGRDREVTFSAVPAPGTWRPTPQEYEKFTTAPLARMRPLLMRRPDQFRPGPPPALTSARYARELKEVREYGARTGSLRTARQTETARFFARMDTQSALGDHAARHRFDIVEAARLYAAVNATWLDALIAAWDAKLHYATWRPVTAIREADTDGNPATDAHPTWSPLLATPAHPDYLSGHATVGGALTGTLVGLFGSSRIDLRITSGATHTTRHYAHADAYNQDVNDARVWAGIHTRTADVVGNATGQRIAAWALERYFCRT